MDLSIVLLTTSISLFIGYIIGKEGLSSGYQRASMKEQKKP